MLAICADPDTVPTQELVELGFDPAVITAALDATMRSPSFNEISYRCVFLDGRVIDHGPP
ncbi:hypothetical protein GCM10027088_27150 [Nocardia goodfellowii]|uniref:Uncharacterized protein n=1 Tax=Nocardia goodfellowii TaxID=882446 RepID=A0ABS4QA85_9NOCA|nr:hypothetical protein [Nocardia goodfellowii]